MARYKLDNYFTLKILTEDYSTGDLVITEGSSEFFWGSIEETTSPALNGQVESQGRLRDRRTVKIIARYYDVRDVKIGSEITSDDISGVFTITDIIDIDFKHYVALMAERTL